MSWLDIVNTMPADWRTRLRPVLDGVSFQATITALEKGASEGAPIYPPRDQVWTALVLTPFSKTNVVIVGQDPYFQPNQAHGLAFSTLDRKTPSSLSNMFKELKSTVPGWTDPTTNNLSTWASQGVLLLNHTLTTGDRPGAHRCMGWHSLTTEIIKQLNSTSDRAIVFLLWGKEAQKLAAHIDATKHHVLKTSHPSGLSAHRGFLGSGCFTETNRLLAAQNSAEVDWRLR